MSHTPGPWGMLRSKKQGRIFISGNGWYKFARVVVRMDGEVIDNKEGMSNARLIAAAPELLSALEACLSDAFDTNCQSARTSVIRNQARAAIAKARGKI